MSMEGQVLYLGNYKSIAGKQFFHLLNSVTFLGIHAMGGTRNTQIKLMTKHPNHDHYWIADCVLYETYRTCRGPRWREVAKVIYPDRDRLSEEEIKTIGELLEIEI